MWIKGRKGEVGIGAWLLAIGLGACGGSTGGSPPGAVALSPLAGHVLRRMAYGPTPKLLERLTNEGVDDWIDAQLHPQSIAESPELLSLLAQIPVPRSEWDAPTLDGLIRVQLARALFSERQLVELMCDFWENHFNTSYFESFAYTGSPQAAAWFEWRENEFLRANALGRFEELLIGSATSPAMLVSLDNVSNFASHPNENYARELMELHTLGVDNGYTQTDIEEIARCFTGWGVCQVAPGSQDDPLASCVNPSGSELWAFHYDASEHDPNSKLIFAGTPNELFVPARSGAGGIEDGYALLRQLARTPQTARFVSQKLVERFVSDQAPQALIDACTATWLATDGDLRAVMTTILTAPDFLDGTNRWNKIETPLESLCSTVRAMGGRAATIDRLVTLRAKLEGDSLGQLLFRWSTPDGFPEDAGSLLSTAALVGRIHFNKSIYAGNEYSVQYDPIGLLQSRGVALEDADEVAGAILELFFQENVSASDRSFAVEFVSTDEAGKKVPLDIHSPDYELRLRQLACFIASLPQGMQQ
jgi:uncharacterized protein (DUF1800 family)